MPAILIFIFTLYGFAETQNQPKTQNINCGKLCAEELIKLIDEEVKIDTFNWTHPDYADRNENMRYLIVEKLQKMNVLADPRKNRFKSEPDHFTVDFFETKENFSNTKFITKERKVLKYNYNIRILINGIKYTYVTEGQGPQRRVTKIYAKKHDGAHLNQESPGSYESLGTLLCDISNESSRKVCDDTLTRNSTLKPSKKPAQKGIR